MMFARQNGKSTQSLKLIKDQLKKQANCTWCRNARGMTELSFDIIDDDIAQYVPHSFIKFCPFCGRRLNA